LIYLIVKGLLKMKKLISLLVIGLFLVVILPVLAVDVTEDATYVIIKTSGYDAYWNKAAQMGYMQVFVGGSKESIVGAAGRAFYHSGEYAGNWHDWGALQAWKLVDKTGARAIVNFKSNDGGQKDYDVNVTFYDTVPYIKHEVKITNTGDVVIPSFKSGHSPMFEVNADLVNMVNGTKPFPFAVYWTKTGFFGGLYGPEAQEAAFMEWAPRNPGRMHLVHDSAAKEIKKGESHTITYYVAFGKGGEKEAVALADKVKEEPSATAVSPVDTMSTTWGQIRSGY
jgi:hypothetical protein